VNCAKISFAATVAAANKALNRNAPMLKRSNNQHSKEELRR
jgi:hypothetical protein